AFDGGGGAGMTVHPAGVDLEIDGQNAEREGERRVEFAADGVESQDVDVAGDIDGCAIDGGGGALGGDGGLDGFGEFSGLFVIFRRAKNRLEELIDLI